MSEYQVVVGNIGTVHTGRNLRQAAQVWRSYRHGSMAGDGRGAGEPVTLFHNGEIVREWAPAESVWWDVEYTDTFGGESNYSWVKRCKVSVSPKARKGLLMRRAKAALGLSGLRGRTYHNSDFAEFRPYGIATVVFCHWSESGDDS
jgi:hypothetical protein